MQQLVSVLFGVAVPEIAIFSYTCLKLQPIYDLHLVQLNYLPGCQIHRCFTSRLFGGNSEIYTGFRVVYCWQSSRHSVLCGPRIWGTYTQLSIYWQKEQCTSIRSFVTFSINQNKLTVKMPLYERILHTKFEENYPIHFQDANKNSQLLQFFFFVHIKPYMDPQLTEGRLCRSIWFIKIAFQKVCAYVCILVYLSAYLRPREQTIK